MQSSLAIRRYAVAVSLLTAGCGVAPGNPSSYSASSTGQILGAASPTSYRLPWQCGHSYDITQGNHGDECGIVGNHVGIEEYAWDFGLPMRTPVLAVRPGIVTLAATYSPPGSECYNGCPYPVQSVEHALCCAKCLYSANRVNIQHDDGAISTYAHFDEVVVHEGEHVERGDLIGFSGTTGCSTGPHLHFQVMAGCPTGYCQSQPIRFDEPVALACGDVAGSQNSCD
jgi:murein DD-endopeptidase MepM/ murein hydrolase activator NlpD